MSARDGVKSEWLPQEEELRVWVEFPCFRFLPVKKNLEDVESGDSVEDVFEIGFGKVFLTFVFDFGVCAPPKGLRFGAPFVPRRQRQAEPWKMHLDRGEVGMMLYNDSFVIADVLCNAVVLDVVAIFFCDNINFRCCGKKYTTKFNRVAGEVCFGNF